MSKLKHSIWGILTALFAVCCVSEEESLLQEKNSVEVAFRPCLDEGLPTRVIGDATNIDQLRVAVYEGDRHIYTITESWNYVQQNSNKGLLNLHLHNSTRILLHPKLIAHLIFLAYFLHRQQKFLPLLHNFCTHL